MPYSSTYLIAEQSAVEWVPLEQRAAEYQRRVYVVALNWTSRGRGWRRNCRSAARSISRRQPRQSFRRILRRCRSGQCAACGPIDAVTSHQWAPRMPSGCSSSMSRHASGYYRELCNITGVGSTQRTARPMPNDAATAAATGAAAVVPADATDGTRKPNADGERVRSWMKLILTVLSFLIGGGQEKNESRGISTLSLSNIVEVKWKYSNTAAGCKSLRTASEMSWLIICPSVRFLPPTAADRSLGTDLREIGARWRCDPIGMSILCYDCGYIRWVDKLPNWTPYVIDICSIGALVGYIFANDIVWSTLRKMCTLVLSRTEANLMHPHPPTGSAGNKELHCAQLQYMLNNSGARLVRGTMINTLLHRLMSL